MDAPTIRIQVETSYLREQSSPEEPAHAFSYTITLHNEGTVAAQLIARHWLIDDASGTRQEVRGLGVVGQQPLIAPGEAYRYTSGCHLRATTGTMQGSYFFVTEHGEPFEVPIPMFVLDTGHPSTLRVLH